MKNGTWISATNTGNDSRILPSGAVLRVWRASTGHIVRLKARFVFLGKLRPDEINYTELRASVACIELVRLMLSVSLSKGWQINQLDIKSAFMHVLLPEMEKVFISLSELMQVPSASRQVVQIVKSLYGPRQSPEIWYQHLSTVFGKIGSRRSCNAEFLFNWTLKATLYVLLHTRAACCCLVTKFHH